MLVTLIFKSSLTLTLTSLLTLTSGPVMPLERPNPNLEAPYYKAVGGAAWTVRSLASPLLSTLPVTLTLCLRRTFGKAGGAVCDRHAWDPWGRVYAVDGARSPCDPMVCKVSEAALESRCCKCSEGDRDRARGRVVGDLGVCPSESKRRFDM